MQELAALDTRSAWAELVAARAAWEATRRHGAAGDARLRDCRRPLSRRRVHAARADGRATAAAAGRGQPRAGRARPAGGARPGRAAARACRSGPARRALRGRSSGRPRVPAPTPQQRSGRDETVHRARPRQQGQPQTRDQVVMRIIRRTAAGAARGGSRGARLAAVLAAGVRHDRGGKGAGRRPPRPRSRSAPENVVTVETGDIVVGPNVSGELRPQREAKMRAELGGSMLAGAGRGRPGGHARRGARAHRDAHARRRAPVGRVGGANGGEPAGAGPARSRAHREARQGRRARGAGPRRGRAARSARSRRSWPTRSRGWRAPSVSSATRSSARRSAAIVSMRAVNVGDVVSSGTELFTVIDPSSMRLEASVPSEDLSAAAGRGGGGFTVRGYDQTSRADRAHRPQADPTTRQVPHLRRRSRTSAAGSWRACSPRAGSWRRRPAASSCR